jgi:hypothetical protein
MDLGCIKIDPTTKAVTFEIQSKALSGFDLLIQVVMIALFTIPGSDSLDYSFGGGIESIIGTYNLTPENIGEVRAEVARIVNKAQSDIIVNQIGLNIPAEEKLRRLTLGAVTASPETATLDIRIRVENEVGQTKDVVI